MASEQRSDIEALRAIAVLLVIAYHFFPEAVPGGYLGVDVFFVISGYLITHSLVRTKGGARSTRDWLIGFWSRRARRLLPNALLVLVVSGIAGVLLLPPFSLERLGSDIAWSAAFVANWLFIRRSIDYMAWDEGQRSVLLHFWSLAVEEQFYLVWPLLLAGLLRAGSARAQAALAWLIAAASLALCVAMSQSNLAQAFFSTPARAWEPMLGAALALHPLRVAPRLRLPLALAGLGALAAAVVVFGDDSRHPDAWTLWPVGATALVIAAGEGGRAPLRLLSHPLMQGLGARSYSIYLWHWPVLVLGASFAFARTTWGSWALLLVALLLAELAWRRVEQPARFVWARGWSSRRVLAVGLAAAAVVAACGVVLRAQGASGLRELLGLQSRPTLELPPLAQVRNDLPEVYRNGCHLGVDAVQSPACAFGAAGGAESVVLFGDSHAAQWFSALDAVASARGFVLHAWTKSSCPSADIQAWNQAARGMYRQCREWFDATLARIEALAPRLVVLSNIVEHVPAVARADGRGTLRASAAAQAWTAGLERVIERLRARGITVVVIRDVPRPRTDVLDCVYGSADADLCTRTRAEATAIPALDVQAAQRGGAVVWDFSDELCPQGHCPVLQPGTRQPMYRDANHLADSAVRSLVPAVDARWAATVTSRNRPLR